MNLWDRVDVGHPLGCWTWTGARTASGYGALRVDGVVQYAHRVAYELLIGPIPLDLVLDHMCRNRVCVNPDHLEPVGRQENVRRSPLYGGRRTACVNGHAYDEANTWVSPSTGYRACRACNRERHRRNNGVEVAA